MKAPNLGFISYAQDRRILVLTLFAAVVAISLSPISFSANNYWTIDPDFYFYATADGGPIDFASTITATNWYFSNDLVYFEQFKIGGGATLSKVGFYCSGNAQMEVQSLSSTEMRYTVTAPSLETSTTKVYLPTAPTDVQGAEYWNYDSATRTLIVKVIHHSAATIVIEWETLPTPSTLPIGNLITQYLPLGDISGFVIALYTYSMGDIFFGLVILAILTPIYIRYQSLGAVAVIMFVAGTLLETLVPFAGLDLGKILLVLGVAGILYSLFTARD